MRGLFSSLLLCFLLGTGSLWGEQSETIPAEASDPIWEELEPGLELGALRDMEGQETGNSIIRVLRIDPGRFELRLLNASSTEEKRPLTAKEWCRRSGCIAAINASMYQKDLLTSVSFMQDGAHVNNARVSKDNTILAFNPLRPDVPAVKIIDRECDRFEEWRDKYATFVQSIRMLSCNGRNVWTQQYNRWSTAAIGTDRDGKVLFIHVRHPYSTHDLINILMKLPIDLSRAMYVEGGTKAQLYVSSGGKEIELAGSYDSSLKETLSSNDYAWPVPNVIGVARKKHD
jgi:uncharacterized protein YigE (DUF2233 family)